MGRFGARRVMLPGLMLTALALLLMSRVGEHSSYFPTMFFALLLLGLGAGTAFIPLLAIAYPYALRGEDGRKNLSYFAAGSAIVAALGVRAYMTGPA